MTDWLLKTIFNGILCGIVCIVRVKIMIIFVKINTPGHNMSYFVFRTHWFGPLPTVRWKGKEKTGIRKKGKKIIYKKIGKEKREDNLTETDFLSLLKGGGGVGVS